MSPTRSTWNRCRTVHYAVCLTPAHRPRRADRNRPHQGFADQRPRRPHRGQSRLAGLDRPGGDLARPVSARGGPGHPRSRGPGLVLAEVVATHRHPGQLDGVGPARYLSTSPDELAELLGAALVDRPAFTGEPSDALRHLLVLVDDPDYDLDASTLTTGRSGVTLVHYAPAEPHREQYSDPSGRSCASRAAPSNAGRPAAGSPTSTTLTSSAPTTPPTWPASCRGGTPIRRTPGCALRPLAAPLSPLCWGSPTRHSWMCPRCGRRVIATTSCAFRSV